MGLYSYLVEVRDSSTQEVLYPVFALVGAHVSEGDTRLIFRDHKKMLQAKLLRSFAAIAGNSASHFGEATQLLEIDVQQITRRLPLIASCTGSGGARSPEL